MSMNQMSSYQEIQKNKELCKKYPFLIPLWDYNYELDKSVIAFDYDYSFTWLDSLPDGWRTLAIMMCEELREELIKYNMIDSYHFIEVKEKYAEICIYDTGIPNEAYDKGCKVWDIIEAYSRVSGNVCSVCGKPDVPTTTGYIIPLCEECYNKYYNSTEDWNELNKLPHMMGNYTKTDSELYDDVMRIAEKYREQYRMECAARETEFQGTK